MQAPAKQFLRLMNRRSRNGQGILIVAFAFIVLIAFVGIAVDVALMFIRYSALRRAVDSAAIAAAGQVREGTDYATLQAVAASFIGMQGSVSPTSVRVETCETEIDDIIKGVIPPPPGFSAPTTAQEAINLLVNQQKPPSELCKIPPQKLVRVSAQLDSPTTFLRLLGWETVLLEASSVSQTAVLDVALVLDTSRSNSNDTYNDQRKKNPDGSFKYPIDGSGTNQEALKAFNEVLDLFKEKNPDGTPNTASPYELFPYDPDTTTGTVPGGNNTGIDRNGNPAVRYECWKNEAQEAGYNANYAWGGCCNDPTTQSNPGTPDGVPGWEEITVDGVTQRVVSLPDPQYDINWYIYDTPGLKEAAINGNGTRPGGPANSGAQVLSGLPDYNFSDLVCRPFKDVRDAARRFIKRLDFIRGDRLFLVTFNADVRRITPPGSSVPVITDKDTAIRTLNERVGITVNPTGLQGRRCLTSQQFDSSGNPYAPYVNWREAYTYWTVSQCTDTNMGGGLRMARAVITDPSWIRRDSVWVMVLLSDGYPNRTPPYEPAGGNSLDSFFIRGAERPNLTLSASDYELAPGKTVEDYCASPFSPDPSDPSDPFNWRLLHFDNMAYLGMKPHLCVPPYWPPSPPPTGYDPGGAWGAVGTGGAVIKSFGFCPWYTFCNMEAADTSSPVTWWTKPRFPQCTDVDVRPTWWDSLYGAGAAFNSSVPEPWCSDNDPDTRHYCSDLQGIINPVTGCSEFYDADDYARDQADFAGLIDYTSQTKGSFIAMFSIFFSNGDKPVNDNLLGVSMMRYIADAGDNGLIDDRLQQWYRIKREQSLVGASAPPPRDGPRNGLNLAVADNDPQLAIAGEIDPTDPATDPCAPYQPRNNVNSLGYPPAGNINPPSSASVVGTSSYDGGLEWLVKQDCGQYFFASSIAKVNDAFSEIAGRLFTRLSR